MPSRFVLSLKLMKNWVVRESGPEVAKVTMPRVLLPRTGSSGMRAVFQRRLTDGSPWIPTWAMKPSTTRKNATSS